MSLSEKQRDTLISAVLAFLLVAVLRVVTSVASPLDGRQYVDMAGVPSFADLALAAPFAYRMLVPFVARALILAAHVSLGQSFLLLVLAACYGILVLSYYLARRQGNPPLLAAFIMLLMAASLFVVRFPLHLPFQVDVEVLVLMFLAFYFIAAGNVMAALAVAMPGMLAGEFMAVPLIVISVAAFRQAKGEGRTKQILTGSGLAVYVAALLVLPRLLIPIHAVYGANLAAESPVPDRMLFVENLRAVIPNLLSVRLAANVFLALISLWLPAAMLFTRDRWKYLRATSAPVRSAMLLWVVVVVFMTWISGTNSMVYVAYTAPVLVAVLARFIEGRQVSIVELLYVAIGVMVFNRAFLSLGAPGTSAFANVHFYYGYWNQIDRNALWRGGEICGWIAGGFAVREVAGIREKKQADGTLEFRA